MSPDDRNIGLSRREMLGFCMMAIAAPALLSARALAGQRNIPGQPFPFKLGLQSYSLRNFSLIDALAKTKDLGLTWWEAYPNHIPLTANPDKIAGYRDALRSHGVRLISYGV